MAAAETPADPALGAGFARPTLESWRALAEDALEGRDFARALVKRTADGIARGPLMTVADRPAPDATIAARAPRREGFCPWDLCAIADHPDPAEANRQILADLEGGATSIALHVDPSGASGVMIRGLDDLDRALDGVLLDLAPLGLRAGAHALPVAAMVLALADRRGLAPADLRLRINADPLGALLMSGASARDPDVALADAATWAFWCADRSPGVQVFRADARIPFEAGGTHAQAIAWAAASALAYLKSMDSFELPRDLAARQILFAMNTDADVHQSIAAVRALRIVWARIATASRVSPEAARANIHALAARRMLTSRDLWTNMLRLTLAGLGAAVGGADIVTLPPFTAARDDAQGEVPSEFARRVSRNIQMVLQEEAHVGQVLDPAGGGFHHERLTLDLAEAAWGLFQEIERAGGALAAIQAGLVQDWVGAARTRSEAEIDAGKSPILGVTSFPDLAERPAPSLAPDLTRLRAAADARAAARPAPEGEARRSAPDLLIPMAAGGADLAAMAPYAPPTPLARCAPLPPIRFAAPYEALRALADSHAARTGEPPNALLATLGPEAEHGARLSWTGNFLAAAGILARALPAEAAPPPTATPALAVLCGTDAAYVGDAEAAARALAAKGYTVWLAGAPGKQEAALRAAGVSAFAHRNVPLRETLRAALAATGVADV